LADRPQDLIDIEKLTEIQKLTRFWLKATPAQRLAWLEEAIELAHQAGALDAKKHDP